MDCWPLECCFCRLEVCAGPWRLHGEPAWSSLPLRIGILPIEMHWRLPGMPLLPSLERFLRFLETLHKTLECCGTAWSSGRIVILPEELLWDSLDTSRIGISTVKMLEALYAGVDSKQPIFLKFEEKLPLF